MEQNSNPTTENESGLNSQQPSEFGVNTKFDNSMSEEPHLIRNITVVVVLIIVGILVFLAIVGGSTNQTQVDSDSDTLNTQEEAQILESLQNSKVPELTTEEEAQILESLQNSKAPELTPEEEALILESLQNNN